MSLSFAIIVAVDKDFGIGKNGLLPWDLPGEIKHFKEVTTSSFNVHPNVVIMGRKTWESIPSKFRPLPKRHNIVVSRDLSYEVPSGVLKASGLDEALRLVQSGPIKESFGKIFVIGGAELFNAAIVHPQCRELYLTKIAASFSCDRFFPSLPASFREVACSAPVAENGMEYAFLQYRNM